MSLKLISTKSDLGELRLSEAVAGHIEGDRRRRARRQPPEDRVPTSHLAGVVAADNGVDDENDTASEGIASLVRRANHDGLTGLPNRSWFTTAVERDRFERATRRSGALFLIDLDGFKAVNDTWGHGAGDAVLVEIAQRLASISPHTAVCSRFGGDEFAMWISQCTQAQACLIAERILATVSEPVPGDLMLSVGASIGWTLTDDEAPVSSLLSRADVAMYAIKESGGHGHRQFDRVLASQRVEGRVLQREIRHGLSVGQFALARQPIVASDGEVVASEALARWCHPRRGMLSPAKFLPAVESGGNNQMFDGHILSLALAELASEADASQIWVNLTGDSLNEALVERLEDLVMSDAVEPSRIVFEISEHASVDSDCAVAAIRSIANLGFGVAIDDFGSGFSRLGAMATLPISYVKIDQQFVKTVAKDVDARRLCGAIIDLIHAIGAIAVAEGVETSQQADVLSALGCDLFQGYWFGRPALRADSGQREPERSIAELSQAQQSDTALPVADLLDANITVLAGG